MVCKDKKRIIEEICRQLDHDIQTLKAAALATYKAATDEESKPENEYDTRGLEASYLAGAQAQRVREIEEQLVTYRVVQTIKYDENTPIGITALIGVEQNQKEFYLFMMPKGGGLSVKIDGQVIRVITPSSPLGEALMGQKSGDTAVVETGSHTIEYDVISVE